MSAHISEEIDNVKYIVKVNGVAVTPPTTLALAEQHKMAMPAESQPLAEVVPVTGDGNQILFG